VADWLGPLVPFVCSAAFALVGSLVALGLRDAPPPAPTAAASIGAAAQATDNGRGARAGAAAGLLACLLAGAFGWHLILTAIYSVWPNYLATLGYSPAAITRLWALASLSEVPLMAVTGTVSDRIGRRPMLALALGTIGVVVLGYLALPSMPWIALVQVVRAVAWSSFLTASLALTVEVSSYAQRGRVTGLVNTVGAVGDVTGAAAGGTLVRAGGFPALLWSGGGAAFICAGLVLLTGIARFVRPRRQHPAAVGDSSDRC
jgi:MFS family permease